MNNLVLVRGARQLITLRGPREPRRGSLLGQLNIIADGALLIRDGVIIDVGPSRRVERVAASRGATEIDATGRIVLPAFVDGLATVAFAHEGATLSSIPKQRLETRCRSLLEDMARHGTVTIQVETASSVSDPADLKVLRVYQDLDGHPADLIPTYTPAVIPPNDSILHKIAQRRLARFVNVRCAPDAFSTSVARQFLQAAQSLGLGAKLQAPAPAPDEIVALAVEMGAISISHLSYISRADVDLIAESTVIATLCPGAVYHSHVDRFPPARAIIDRGAAVSLASNFNVPYSPSYSMPFVLALACRHMSMTEAEAITAATVNSAYAAGCGARTGSLEPDKLANLIVCNAHDYRDIPRFAGSNLVHMAIKGGVVYQAGKVGPR